MTELAREWFMWAFDCAMGDAVQQHGDAARLAAYEGRIAFNRILPNNLIGIVRDSGSGPQGGDASQAPGEAPQSGGEQPHRPTTLTRTP